MYDQPSMYSMNVDNSACLNHTLGHSYTRNGIFKDEDELEDDDEDDEEDNDGQ